MAIYHLSVKTVSRSSGRSAVAAAAYRSAGRFCDERTGVVHNYTRKVGIAHTQIVAPAGTAAVFYDREKLWNLAEAGENRKNSTTAREYEIALPNELSAEQRKHATLEFAGWLTERFGVVADVAIHMPHTHGDDRNHHAHILTTTRAVIGDRFGKKTRELDDQKSGAITEVREKWATIQNQVLAQAQLRERVDHRSLADQRTEALECRDIDQLRQVDREPGIKMGAAAAIQRRGGWTDRGRRLRDVQIRNRARQAVWSLLVGIDAEQVLYLWRKYFGAARQRPRREQLNQLRALRQDLEVGKAEASAKDAQLERLRQARAALEEKSLVTEPGSEKKKTQKRGRGLGLEL
jgi:uncharacterized membrane protein